MNIQEYTAIVVDVVQGNLGFEDAASDLLLGIPPIETRFLILAGLLVLGIIVNLAAGIVRNRRSLRGKGEKGKKKGSADKDSVREEIADVMKERRLPRRILNAVKLPFAFLWRKKLAFFNITVGIIFFAVLGVTLFMRPFVIRTSPKVDTYMEEAHEMIEVEFDIPFDPDEIEFNVSPEIDGHWEYENAAPWFPLPRKAKFYPEESFYPDSEVVIYVVGIKPLISAKDVSHEHAIEFMAPKVPQIATISPEKDSQNVPVDSEVVIEYDAPLGEFVDLEMKIDPEVEYQVTSEGNKQILEFKEGLSQDHEYVVDVYRTPRSYDVESGEDKTLGDTEKIESIKFKTVTTPLVESYKPKGDGVLVDNDIKVVFDQEMDHESVESHFSITPEVAGQIAWEDERTFMLRPDKPLKKETKYQVKFTKGILSKYSGVTDEDVVINFTTIGKVGVAATSPVNGAYGLNPKTANVVVEFNQEVDHASAQQKFSISPSVSGTFSWDGNSLIYATAGKLAYSTRYTVSIAAGVKTVHGIDSDKAFSFAFTTKDNIVTINVPYYHQQENFSCNLAAARMALAYKGVYVSEAQMKSWIGVGGDPNADWVSGYGVHWGPVASFMGQYRQVAVKSGWNVAELAKEVENGNPVILWWYNRYSQPAGAFTLPSGATGYKGMHSEVVYGFVGDSSNPTTLMTRDPWRGSLSYSQSGFLGTWSYLNYTAVVVY